MATDRGIRLTPDQALHERVMRAVALRMQTTPFVLKGGTALALLYGLDRHSMDLDFDVGKASGSPLSATFELACRTRMFPMSAFKRGRPMWRGRRYRVHYLNPDSGESRVLTLELSSRKRPRPKDVVVVDGIRTYRISALFDQKMDAAGDRTKGRDLFDLGFLAESYGDRLSNEQILRADEFSRDYEGLADRYRRAFRMLSGWGTRRLPTTARLPSGSRSSSRCTAVGRRSSSRPFPGRGRLRTTLPCTGSGSNRTVSRAAVRISATGCLSVPSCAA